MGKTIREIASESGWSYEAVRQEFLEHNSTIKRTGECPRCKRARSEFSKTVFMIGPKYCVEHALVVKEIYSRYQGHNLPTEPKYSTE